MRRALALIGVIALSVLVLAAMSASPVAMVWMAKRLPRFDWSLASNIGQSYGLAATVLSALAIFGVIYTVALQRRQNRADRQNDARALHQDLLNSALSNELLLEVWRQPNETVHSSVLAQRIYVNMTVSQWQTLFDLGMLSEDELRLNASALLGTDHGKYYWTVARDARRAVARSRRDRRFVDVLDEAFLTNVPDQAESPKDALTELRGNRGFRAVTAMTLVGTVAAIVLLRNNRR